MMYADKFIAVVKCKGRILRERNHQNTGSGIIGFLNTGDSAIVTLPFGSEYSLSFKNLHSRKAAVSVTIDGEDVLNGNRLIVNPNEEYPLERFLTENMSKGNRFKFIQKTQQIVENRGDKMDDGFVRIEWQYEAPAPVYVPRPLSFYRNDSMFLGDNRDRIGGGGSMFRSAVGGANGNSQSGDGAVYSSATRSMHGANSNVGVETACFASASVSDGAFCDTVVETNLNADEGLTVKGSVSKQQFQRGYLGPLETEKHVMVLQLRGTDAHLNEVSEPILVRTKLKCEVCSTVSPSKQQFCGGCGAALAAIVK